MEHLSKKQLLEENKMLRQEVDRLNHEMTLMRQKMDLLIRRMFGRSSEKMDENQLDLFLLGIGDEPGKGEASSLQEADPAKNTKARCIEPREISAAKRDTIINKTAISARTNRSIGGRAPSEYLQRLRNSAGCDEARQRQILETHLIDYDALSGDDFDRFLSSREDALIRLIEAATGKAVSRTATQSNDSADEASFCDENDEQTI